MKIMKRIVLVGAVLASTITANQAQTSVVNGTISFEGIASVTGGTSLATDTSLSAIRVVVGEDSGDYGSIPSVYGSVYGLTWLTSTGSATGVCTSTNPGLINDFTFNPPQGAVTPLCSFNSGGLTYAFSATSMAATYDSSAQEWVISGAGLASITGFTTKDGTWNANVGAEGSSFFFGFAFFTLTIGTTSPLLSGTVGQAYSTNFIATGGTAPYVWELASGALPTGLSLNTNGLLSGTPTVATNASFTVQVTDANDTYTSQAFSLVVLAPQPSIDIQEAVDVTSVYLTSTDLLVGLNYQVQASSDLINWTNQGSVFTATNSNWQSTNYWNVNNWNQLFFQLQVIP
jgi:hypothetical protein